MFDTSRQNEILNTLIESWSRDDRVVYAWVEGSLAEGRGNPASDIDLRVVVNETIFPEDVLDPLRYYVSVYDDVTHSTGERVFCRVITNDGIVIDLDVYDLDNLSNIVVPRHKVLLSKIGDFKLSGSSVKTLSVAWPALPVDLNRLTIDLCVVMASVPTMFYGNNTESAAFQLDLMRVELVKIMYHLAGVRYANRYKHMRELFSGEWLKKLALTYPTTLRVHEIARSYAFTYRVIGEFLELLCHKNECEFEAELYWSVYGKMSGELERF